jgi:hypothetical protein
MSDISIGLRDPKGWLALLAGAVLAAAVVLGVRLLDEVVYEDAPGYSTSLWSIEEPETDEGL